MINKFRERLDDLFLNAPKTHRAMELKEELLANLMDKYNDLVSSGMSEQDAFNITISGIGDIDDLIAGLKEKDPTDYQKIEKQRKKRALLISLAVGMYIIGVVILIFFNEVLNVNDGLSVCIMLTIDAVATGIIIYCSISHPKYIKSDTTIVEEFKEWKSSTNADREVLKSIKAIVWLIIMALYFFLGFVFGMWAFSWIIFIIGAAIIRIISLAFQLRKWYFMNKTLIKVLIVIWSIIAIFFTSLFIYCIINKGVNNMPFYFDFDNSDNANLNVQLDKEISSDNINKISVDCLSSNIVILNSDDSNIRVVQKSTKDLSDNQKCQINQGNEELTVKLDNYRNFGFFSFNTNKNIVEIYIPKNYNKDLYLKTASGDIQFNSELKLNSLTCKDSSGDVKSKEKINTNDANINISSGDIDLYGIISNNYDIETASGDISVDSLSGSGKVSTASGDIKLKYNDIAESSKVHTASGDIDLTVPAELSFEFNGSCTSGNISSNLNLDYTKGKKQASFSSGNESNKKIDASTLSGDISINH